MKRKNESIQADSLSENSDSDINELIEEIGSVARYRAEMKAAREERVRLAKARLKAVSHGRD
jgi:hypothetical protein